MDKFQLVATVDRLIYENVDTFNAVDATTLLAAMPAPSWRRFLPAFSITGSGIGRSTQGVAAGFGNIGIRENGKSFEFDAQGALRIGQWKLFRGWRSITIEQVASDQLDDQRSAMIVFSLRWVPVRMDLLILSSIPIGKSSGVSWGTYNPWKRPA